MRATGPSQPAQFLLDVIDVLHELGIPYVVVGAFAVSYHGVPRSTADGDAAVWLGSAGKSAQDLRDRLQAHNYQSSLSRGDVDDPIQAVIAIKDTYENHADLLIGVRGMDPDAASRCVSTTLLESSVRIIGAEDLIAMKVFAGGPQDLADVQGILQVSGNLLDMDLLRDLAGRYGIDASRTLDRVLKEPR